MLVRFAIVPRSLVGCRGVVGLSVVSGGGERASFQKPRTQLLHNWAGWRSWEALKKNNKKKMESRLHECFLHGVCAFSMLFALHSFDVGGRCQLLVANFSDKVMVY